MSNKNFYKDLLDPGNDNSDVSEVGPEDLANIAKGVDDMDDALFGFNITQKETQKSKSAVDELKTTEHLKSTIKKKTPVSDFPEGDLLADISLSDDDFYDVGKKSSAASKSGDRVSTSSPKKSTQDKLTKSKKIANLFGLDEEDDAVADGIKKQESAADWLGIKDSPVKTPNPPVEDKTEAQARKKSLTENLFENKTTAEIKKSDLQDEKSALGTSGSGEIDMVTVNALKTKVDSIKYEPARIRSAKPGEVFDLLDVKNETKTVENLKDKKSAIFDELFGDTSLGPKKTSRRNSAAKTPEIITNEPTAPSTLDESSTRLGQYVPSTGASRRPGLGRRRDTTLVNTTPPASLLFQEDWLKSTNHQETKKETSQQPKADEKSSVKGAPENLPMWLGGTVVLPATKSKVQQLQVEAKEVEKSFPEKPVPVEPEKKTNDQVKDKVTDMVREALVSSAEQSQQTALALQRTEAQVLAALELQTTQNSLAAVCARQRSILDSQEKQLAQLVSHQMDRQSHVEKQLVAQQERIQYLLEVLTENLSLPPAEVIPRQPAKEVVNEKENNQNVINSLERDIQKATMDNEELRLRIKLMEKHFNMEYESLQVQHRREIESWEDQLAKQKELSDHLKEEFKERIARLKENEAELITQHNERVQRLREERAEDMRQLMQFHKMTLEQMTVITKLIPPPVREEEKPSLKNWKPLDSSQISEKEEKLFKKEKTLSALQEKLEAQKEASEKQIEEIEIQLEQEKIKNEEIARQLKQEQSQLKYKQQQLNQDRKHLEEQQYVQRKMLEEMQEKVMSEQTQLVTEKLALAEERAKLDALAKLQGVSGTASFDVLKMKAEVHGALEAARAAEMQAVEERKRLREKERTLDTHRWKLQEMEEDLAARSEHLDRLLQVSDASQEAGRKALEEAKELEKKANEKLQEVERRRAELREKEKSLIRVKLDIAQEEIRINRKREHLEHILPQLSLEEAITLQPIKGVIDPKKLIMKLRAEKEFEVASKTPQVGIENTTT